MFRVCISLFYVNIFNVNTLVESKTARYSSSCFSVGFCDPDKGITLAGFTHGFLDWNWVVHIGIGALTEGVLIRRGQL